jgi:cardiolipin synthase
MLAVDGTVGFVSGLCVGQAWVGDAGRNIAPWRDTGVEVRGPAVRQIDTAFAQMWAMMGAPIPDDGKASTDPIAPAGETPLRIVATLPATAGLLRLGQLVAALARERLWLTDAYYAGTPLYAEGLRAAARDGVDVRLLVPNGTDIPLLRPAVEGWLSHPARGGVRVFEWNGTMLHAKTAVADGRWARVGSTNLNPASWLGNCELDVLIETSASAARWRRCTSRTSPTPPRSFSTSARAFDDARTSPTRRRRAAAEAPGARPRACCASATRSARPSSTGGTLEPVETRIMLAVSIALLILATLVAVFPRLIAYPFAALAVWIAGALMYRCYRLRRTASTIRDRPQAESVGDMSDSEEVGPR